MSRVDNTAFYHAAISQHGFNAQGLHWRSQEAQYIRFYQLSSLLPQNAQTIIDAGCGFGDLYGYLRSNGRESMHYTGLDALEIMVMEAASRTAQPIYRCDVLHDPLPDGEFYVCSGALNILTRYEAHRFIRRCYEASSCGVIFNFLEGDDTSATYNYLRASHLEALGKHLGAHIEFRRGYYGEDCTAAFYKKREKSD